MFGSLRSVSSASSLSRSSSSVTSKRLNLCNLSYCSSSSTFERKTNDNDSCMLLSRNVRKKRKNDERYRFYHQNYSNFNTSSNKNSNHHYSHSNNTDQGEFSFHGIQLSLLLCIPMLLQEWQQNSKKNISYADSSTYINNRDIRDFYNIVEKPVGAGGFGVVSTGVHRETGEKVAIKQLPRRLVSRSKVMEEVEILQTVGDHNNVVTYKDLFVNDDYYYIVMESASGGELFDRLVVQGAYSESQASGIMFEITEAIAYLHQQGIVHCDVKPENILLATEQRDDSNMRLIDFGSAFRMDASRPIYRKGSGTIAYSAPEVLLGQPCDYKADIWSLGVLLYILLSGYHPFDPVNDANDDEVSKRIQCKQDHYKYVSFQSPVWKRISPTAKQLVESLLKFDPRERPSAQELLHNPWLSGNEELSSEPLEASVENLRKFHRGRRRLKALMLAIMAGLGDDREMNIDVSTDMNKEVHNIIKAYEEEVKQRSISKSGVRNDVKGIEDKNNINSTHYFKSSMVDNENFRKKDNNESHQFEQRKISNSLPAYSLGSRRAAIHVMDQDNKGYVDANDLYRVSTGLGEDLEGRDILEMLKSATGDPYSKATTITNTQLLNLLPPLCPSKVFKRGEALYKEGDIDGTFYLMQKGEALIRSYTTGKNDDENKYPFSSLTHRTSPTKLPVEVVRSGMTFGELELLMNTDGTMAPRTTSCECLTSRCEVIAVEDYLFSLLTDVYTNVNTKLRNQAEERARRIIDTWMNGIATGNGGGSRQVYNRNQTIWDRETSSQHILINVRSGFVETEWIVVDPGKEPEIIKKRYGPGTYLWTKPNKRNINIPNNNIKRQGSSQNAGLDGPSHVTLSKKHTIRYSKLEKERNQERDCNNHLRRYSYSHLQLNGNPNEDRRYNSHNFHDHIQDHNRTISGIHQYERCISVKTLTDADVIHVPCSRFEGLIRDSHRSGLIKYVLDLQEERLEGQPVSLIMPMAPSEEEQKQADEAYQFTEKDGKIIKSSAFSKKQIGRNVGIDSKENIQAEKKTEKNISNNSIHSNHSTGGGFVGAFFH